jgi:hypothetical protein
VRLLGSAVYIVLLTLAAAAMAVFRDDLSSGEAILIGPTLGQVLDWTASIFGATGAPLRAARLLGALLPSPTPPHVHGLACEVPKREVTWSKMPKCRRSSVVSFGSRSRSVIASRAASTRPISASAYLSHSWRPVIVALQVFNAVGTHIDVIQQGDQNARVQTRVNPVVHLDQDRRWNHRGSVASSTRFLQLR